MLRELSYLFVQSKRMEQFSMLSRLSTAIFIIVYLTYTRFGSRLETEVVRTTLILVVVFAVLSMMRGLRTVLSGIKLIALFTLVGALVFYVSNLVGWLSPDPSIIPLGALRLLAFFLSFSLFFQVISLEEWRYLFNKVGLKSQAWMLPVVIAHIPIAINYLSESSVTIKLKYKSKRPYKLVVPLILLSLYTARGLYEAHLIYGGVSKTASKPVFFKKHDLVLYAGILALVISSYLIS